MNVEHLVELFLSGFMKGCVKTCSSIVDQVVKMVVAILRLKVIGKLAVKIIKVFGVTAVKLKGMRRTTGFLDLRDDLFGGRLIRVIGDHDVQSFLCNINRNVSAYSSAPAGDYGYFSLCHNSVLEFTNDYETKFGIF